MTLRGVAASSGIAVGRAHVLPRPGRAPRRLVEDRDGEVGRLRRAIEESRADIEAAAAQLRVHGSDAALVLDAQLLMHGDEMLASAAAREIAEDGLNAEWAIEQVVARLRQPLEASSSHYFRERAQDVEQVGRHIRRHLRGEVEAPLPDGEVVLVAADLTPADVARILGSDRRAGVVGLVTESGSATSHTAIVARALRVPAVVGVAELLENVPVGAALLIDGFAGTVRVDVSAEDAERARERGERHRTLTLELVARADRPTTTTDDVAIAVRANLDLSSEAALARDHGARGVGLYRTEFLYLDRGAPPSEDEQLEVYRSVVQSTRGLVTFRAFDLGGDKLPKQERLPPAPNPALGLRGLRLALRRPEMMRAQMRAILRVAALGDVRLLLPLVTTLGEFREALEVMARCRAELHDAGVEYGVCPVGAMVEVPSAALIADRLAAEAAFLSVGTNDLVQYTLAVDRTHPDVTHLGQALDPAVLRLLAMVSDRALATPLGCCGDMAADPLALPVLLGLGYREISVPVPALPIVQEVVRRVAVAELETLAKASLEAHSASEVRRVVREHLGERLADLIGP